MQILESSMLGPRAARHRLTSPGSPVSVTLFPMVHVGEPAFFGAVHDDAFGHDVVLVEGIDSPVVRHLTSSYRWIDLAKLGLVVQPRHPPAEAERARIVHADLSADEFHAEWRQVPLWLRAACFALAPAIGLKRRLLASRESLAGKMVPPRHFPAPRLAGARSPPISWRRDSDEAGVSPWPAVGRATARSRTRSTTPSPTR